MISRGDSMSNIHLRGLEKQLIQKLKQNATQQNISMNTLILNMLRQQVGLLPMRKPVVYHDLDKFAGNWTAADEKEFKINTKGFERIDKDLWK